MTARFLAITALWINVYAEQVASDAPETEGYTVEEERSVKLPERYWVLPSPSGEFVAVLTREQSLIYHLHGDECSGPATHDEGPVFRAGTSYESWRPRWVTGGDGKETLILDAHEKRGIKVSGMKWVEVSMPDIDLEKSGSKEEHIRCRNKAAGASCLLTPLLEAKKRKEKPWDAIDYTLDLKLQLERASSNGRHYLVQEDQIEIEFLVSIHPELDRVIAYTEDQSRLICANLDTGSARELEVVGHHGVGGSYATAQYSPDGKWILACFNYGPDDHYGGGYLQLFTSEGIFVEELASFPEDVASPAGESFWLPNDWIVYSDRFMIHFLKWRYLH
jgi:hypothetical protein